MSDFTVFLYSGYCSTSVALCIVYIVVQSSCIVFLVFDLLCITVRVSAY